MVQYSMQCPGIAYADAYDYLITHPVGSYIWKSNTVFSLFNSTFSIIFSEKPQ